jgi:hypothetical protein
VKSFRIFEECSLVAVTVVCLEDVPGFDLIRNGSEKCKALPGLACSFRSVVICETGKIQYVIRRAYFFFLPPRAVQDPPSAL